MIKPKIGFIIFGQHKDGTHDHMGTPHMDFQLYDKCKDALRRHDIELICEDVVVRDKAEAKEALRKFRIDDEIDGIILFSGTWVWSANLIAAVREYAKTEKGIVLWTIPGATGWRTVGGLVMHGAMNEIGIAHKCVYGNYDDETEIKKIVSYCRAAALKNKLNMSTVGSFGGRGMGQTVGVADPSQVMKMFGIDIDSRDTTQLIECAKAFSDEEVKALYPRLEKLFGSLPKEDAVTDRSLRIYLALKKKMAEWDFDYYTIQSFPGIGDDYTATCFAQSLVLDDGIGTSTLGDFNTLLTTIALTELSGQPVYYGDLQVLVREENEIRIIGDGACPPSLAGDLDPAAYAHHGVSYEGKMDGLSVQLTCKPGEGVVARLARMDGEYAMTIARCTVYEPKPEELQSKKLECGSPMWPHAFCRIHGDLDVFIENWNNEYACLGYGGDELYDQIAAFCDITGIRKILI
ncbi:hypothetical protein EAI28_08475 [Faecalicatena contorta]|uniref:hypothetical protein n=1 Tax=Faecalicatena contorta TaxID=39482 RepID=UPI00129E4E77|nr:hypothetical protein [Faecalicatena contorta]MRM88394.1 hypothetical protein [Faecalicatena contorta]